MNAYTWDQLRVGMAANFEVVVDDEMMDRFLATTGDANPLHSDVAYAEARGYPGRVVYGLLTASFYSTLAGVHLPGRHCLLHGLKADFNAPVYVGDRLRVRGTISHLTDACRQLELVCDVTNQRDEVVSKARLRVGVSTGQGEGAVMNRIVTPEGQKLGQLIDGPIANRLIGAQKVNVSWDQLAVAGARLLSDAQVWRLFELAVADLSIALCLHHVSRRSRDELTIPATELDAFVERASAIEHVRGDQPWLTVSFDDGYEDAWHYVVTRARRFPSVEWLLFVCPTKTEQQAGFRWDLDVEDESERDPHSENRRLDLGAVVHLSDAHLATVEQCRYLKLFENAHLGNHTNCHFRATALPMAAATFEIHQSHADFERLFGAEQHFAFPFGGRGIDFDDSHVESVRRASRAVIWSTVGRPHRAVERVPGAVLPRFGVDGRWTASQIAFWIAMRSLRARAQGLPSLALPPPPVS